jgi:hypothetical protein
VAKPKNFGNKISGSCVPKHSKNATNKLHLADDGASFSLEGRLKLENVLKAIWFSCYLLAFL